MPLHGCRPVKIVGKHCNGCYGVKNMKAGVWPTPWGPLAWGNHGEPTVRTERRYGKLGRVFITWIRYVCNDTKCKAELHVQVDWIIERAQQTKWGKLNTRSHDGSL